MSVGRAEESGEGPAYAVAERLRLRILGRLAGGEFGAYLAATAAGDRVVVKVLPPDPNLSVRRVSAAVELAATLRGEGYPAPRYLDVGSIGSEIYTVQEACSGAVPDRLRARHVRQLIKLWQRHEGGAERAGQAPHDWSVRLAGDLSAGRKLLGDTPAAAPYSYTAKAVGLLERGDPGVLRTSDAVHGDFHNGNLLAAGDVVVAVFDWESARTGDCRADLLRLAAAAIGSGELEPEAEALLRSAVEEFVPQDVRAMLGSIQVLDDLWFARYWNPDALPWVLNCAEFLIGDL